MESGNFEPVPEADLSDTWHVVCSMYRDKMRHDNMVQTSTR